MSYIIQWNYSTIKKEILLYATTQIHPENIILKNIILSEIRQSEKYKYYVTDSIHMRYL